MTKLAARHCSYLDFQYVYPLSRPRSSRTYLAMTAIGVCLNPASRARGLLARVIDRYWRQLLDLELGEVEPDPGLDCGDRTDRDGHFLAPPTGAPPASGAPRSSVRVPWAS